MEASSARGRPSEARLWYGITGPTLAWIVQGLGGVMIARAACRPGREIPRPGDGTTLSLVVLSIAMLAVAVSALLLSWRAWREEPGDRLEHAEATGRRPFLALTGILVSAVFTLGIVWGGIAPFVLGVCALAR